MIVHPNGIGIGYADDQLLAAKPLYTSGNVWYVNSATGIDAPSPRGLSPEYPLAQLDQAVANSASGDVIVLMANHSEDIAAQIVLAKDLTIVGQGRTSGIPSVSLNHAIAGAEMIVAVVARVEFRNVRFGPAVVAGTFEALILGTTPGTKFVGCRFEVGALDTAAVAKVSLTANTGGPEFIDCAFASVAPVGGAVPVRFVYCEEANPNTLFQRCTFSAGASGFAGDGYAVRFHTAQDNLVLEDLTLQGADLFVHADSTGRYNVASSTGASRVVW